MVMDDEDYDDNDYGDGWFLVMCEEGNYEGNNNNNDIWW